MHPHTLKKLIAASLLIIYVFNLGGQLAMHQYFAYLSDRFFNEQTSKGLYNVGDLTEVKLPVDLPGISDWKGYENISGQIQFENVSYNYVKMKITRHCMYLMCVPDYKATRLCATNIINAKGLEQASVPKKNHVPFGKMTIRGKFNIAFTQFVFSSFSKTLKAAVIPTSRRLIWHSPSIPEQPPQPAC